jgi:hypothetical protein
LIQIQIPPHTLFFWKKDLFTKGRINIKRRDIMLYERDVINTVCSELENKGYTIVSKKTELRHTGVDIIAKKVDYDINERFFIEAVGGTSSDPNSKRYGKPFDKSQCRVHVAEQLFACAEILSKPKIEGITYKVAMAFDDNEYYREYIDSIKNTLVDLNIEVIFVNNRKEIIA